MTFTDKYDYRAHLTYDCAMMQVVCDICKKGVRRGKHLKNDKRPGLEKMVNSLRAEKNLLKD
jgi:hypothetical protein